MRKLTKDQAAEWAKLKEAVSDAFSQLNAALADADSFRTDIVSEMDAYIAEKSDKWLEGTRGAAYQSWRDAWDDMDFSEPIETEMDAPEEPEE